MTYSFRLVILLFFPQIPRYFPHKFQKETSKFKSSKVNFLVQIGDQKSWARFGDKFNDYSYTNTNMQGPNQARGFTAGDPDIRQLLSYDRHIGGEKIRCGVQNSSAIQRRASNCLESSVISPFTESNMSMFNQNRNENVHDSRDLQYQNISMGEYFTKNNAEFQRMPLRDIDLSDKENRQCNVRNNF